ncbi:MAG: NAD-dependent epimerase/dehydratase family protein [Micromonosporaceae bacterium]
MRIFVAGASGALGRRLVPMLTARGFQVTGSAHTASGVTAVAAAGADPVRMDGLDRHSVERAVRQARPDVVIHQLSALKGAGNPKKFDQEFAVTNRLRVEAGDHLLAAAQDAGATRFIAQSFTGWTNERVGAGLKDETVPVDPRPARGSERTLAAIKHLEEAVAAAKGLAGLALRYGIFYGPGTGLGAGGDLLEMIRKRKLPVVGGGAGVWSMVHIDDAASATVCAVERGASGVYNIVDNEPAPVAAWLPYLADVIGAKPPLRLPGWLAKPMLGEHGLSLMTQIRGSSNAKAKAELGWAPAYPSWREGFRSGLA